MLSVAEVERGEKDAPKEDNPVNMVSAALQMVKFDDDLKEADQNLKEEKIAKAPVSAPAAAVPVKAPSADSTV